MKMKELSPILVVDLFPELLDELLQLLTNLTAEEWNLPTICTPWTVKDLSLHLLADDVGMLSRGRDKYRSPSQQNISGWEDLVTFINNQNDLWVRATRRVSPRLACELLKITGEQVCDYFKSLDPFAIGKPVDWVGPEPAPVWLDLAREFTERWHHQQQIRDAVNKSGLMQAHYLGPVLDTFVRALPHTFRNIEAPTGTLVKLTVTGEAGNNWYLLKEPAQWQLYLEIEQEPEAEVVIPQDMAWRVFTKGTSPAEILPQIEIKGSRPLGLTVLDTVSIIA
jgi:uncharacterized protein (TIGR03083 family)